MGIIVFLDSHKYEKDMRYGTKNISQNYKKDQTFRDVIYHDVSMINEY